MSFHVFFSFSTGLAQPLSVPKGTKAEILAHVEEVERVLGLERTKFGDNPAHWTHWNRNFDKVPDDLLCKTVEKHNRFVQRLYEQLEAWTREPVADGEQLTPEDAAEFWHGLEMLKVPPARWNREYYRARMDELYEVMRGREAVGMSLDARTLTPRQAAAVVRIFDQYLDPNDDRLDVPHGYDHLASSYDGGYDWCDKCCRPIHPDDNGCGRRKCPLREGDD